MYKTKQIYAAQASFNYIAIRARKEKFKCLTVHGNTREEAIDNLKKSYEKFSEGVKYLYLINCGAFTCTETDYGDDRLGKMVCVPCFPETGNCNYQKIDFSTLNG